VIDNLLIPGKNCPLAMKAGGERETLFVVESLVSLAKSYSEPSPIHLASAISEAVLIGGHPYESAWKVHIAAQRVANAFGDWCGGYLDPMEIGRRCLVPLEEPR